MFPNRGFEHDQWWGSLHGVIPLLLMIALVAVAIWAIIRTVRQRPAAPASVGAVPSLDTAIQEARLRYARGELDRETFLQIESDLSGAPRTAPAVAGPPPATSEPTPPAS